MACNISIWRRVAFLPLFLALVLLLSACEAAPEEAADPSFTVRVICESEDVYQIFYTFYIGDESRGMGGMADLEGKALTNETDLTLTFTESYLESADISQFSMDFSPYGKDDISEIGTTNRVYIPAEYGAAYTIVFAGNEADGFTATLEE